MNGERSSDTNSKIRKIEISNLSNRVNIEEMKKELFYSQNFKVSQVSLSGNSAFVTLASNSEARRAAKLINGQLFKGRRISVTLASTSASSNMAYLVVSNLPFDYDEEQFQKMMEPHGEISRLFLVRNKNGQSKGYGFVEYTNKDSATKAKEYITMSEARFLNNKVLRVEFVSANLLEGANQHTKTLFIDRLPKSFDDDRYLEDLFHKTGRVTFCKIAFSHNGPKGYAFVDYDTVEEAEQSQEYHDGTRIGDSNIRVSFCTPGKSGRDILGKNEDQMNNRDPPPFSGPPFSGNGGNMQMGPRPRMPLGFGGPRTMLPSDILRSSVDTLLSGGPLRLPRPYNMDALGGPRLSRPSGGPPGNPMLRPSLGPSLGPSMLGRSILNPPILGHSRFPTSNVLDSQGPMLRAPLKGPQKSRFARPNTMGNFSHRKNSPYKASSSTSSFSRNKSTSSSAIDRGRNTWRSKETSRDKRKEGDQEKKQTKENEKKKSTNDTSEKAPKKDDDKKSKNEEKKRIVEEKNVEKGKSEGKTDQSEEKKINATKKEKEADAKKLEDPKVTKEKDADVTISENLSLSELQKIGENAVAAAMDQTKTEGDNVKVLQPVVFIDPEQFRQFQEFQELMKQQKGTGGGSVSMQDLVKTQQMKAEKQTEAPPKHESPKQADLKQDKPISSQPVPVAKSTPGKTIVAPQKEFKLKPKVVIRNPVEAKSSAKKSQPAASSDAVTQPLKQTDQGQEREQKTQQTYSTKTPQSQPPVAQKPSYPSAAKQAPQAQKTGYPLTNQPSSQSTVTQRSPYPATNKAPSKTSLIQKTSYPSTQQAQNSPHSSTNQQTARPAITPKYSSIAMTKQPSSQTPPIQKPVYPSTPQQSPPTQKSPYSSTNQLSSRPAIAQKSPYTARPQQSSQPAKAQGFWNTSANLSSYHPPPEKANSPRSQQSSQPPRSSPQSMVRSSPQQERNYDYDRSANSYSGTKQSQSPISSNPVKPPPPMPYNPQISNSGFPDSNKRPFSKTETYGQQGGTSIEQQKRYNTGGYGYTSTNDSYKRELNDNPTSRAPMGGSHSQPMQSDGRQQYQSTEEKDTIVPKRSPSNDRESTQRGPAYSRSRYAYDNATQKVMNAHDQVSSRYDQGADQNSEIRRAIPPIKQERSSYEQSRSTMPQPSRGLRALRDAVVSRDLRPIRDIAPSQESVVQQESSQSGRSHHELPSYDNTPQRDPVSPRGALPREYQSQGDSMRDAARPRSSLTPRGSLLPRASISPRGPLLPRDSIPPRDMSPRKATGPRDPVRDSYQARYAPPMRHEALAGGSGGEMTAYDRDRAARMHLDRGTPQSGRYLTGDMSQRMSREAIDHARYERAATTDAYDQRDEEIPRYGRGAPESPYRGIPQRASGGATNAYYQMDGPANKRPRY